MFRSSIFSFETLDAASIPRGWSLSLVLALAIFASAEGVARWLAAPLGEHLWTYWDLEAVDKFEWYRRAAVAGEAPEVVVIGDSTGARNFDPAAFARSSGRDSVYNLAWPANFPLALAVNTIPLLSVGDSPEIVILMASPRSYIDSDRVRRFESSIVSGVQGKRARGELVVADIFHMNRLYLGRQGLVDHWLRGRSLIRSPKRQGFMPLSRGSAVPAVDQQDLDPAPEFAMERRAVVRRLVELGRERGFRLIVFVGPYMGSDSVTVEHVSWLEALAKEHPGDLEVWDPQEIPGLLPTDFRDPIHLWRDGAGKFSAWLGHRLRLPGS